MPIHRLFSWKMFPPVFNLQDSIKIIFQNSLWSLATWSWMKSQGRGQGRLRTQQRKRWKGREEPPLLSEFFSKPQRTHEGKRREVTSWFLGCWRGIWTHYKYKASCSQSYLLFHQIQHYITLCRSAQTAQTHFQICKLCDLAGSIGPTGVCIQFSERVSPSCKS